MPIAPLLAMSAILFLGVSAAAWRKREGSQRHRGGGPPHLRERGDEVGTCGPRLTPGRYINASGDSA